MCYYSIFILHISILSTYSQLLYLWCPKIHTSESHIVHYMTWVIISCSTLNKPEKLTIIYHGPNGLNEMGGKRKRQHPCFKRYLAARVISLLLQTWHLPIAARTYSHWCHIYPLHTTAACPKFRWTGPHIVDRQLFILTHTTWWCLYK